MRITRKRWGRASGVLAGALLGLLTFAIAPAANAATTAPSTGESAQTCWFNTDNGVEQCFDSYADFKAAVEEQTGGPLLFAGDQVSAQTPGRTVSPAATAATYVLATFYDNANYDSTHGSVNITTTHSTLCQSYSYTGNTMPSGWNDRVSSFHSYGTCKTRLAWDINQGQPYSATAANIAQLGAMNDKASSYWITG